jgi:hypothetical protein
MRKHSTLWPMRGRLLYQAIGNVGAASILRREIWDRGVRVRNLSSPGTYRFPDDAQLSEDVAMAGYRIAWADRRLVRNIGYTEEEFNRREEYYGESFRSNLSYNEEAWQRERELFRTRPHPARASFLFPRDTFLPEKTVASEECRMPQLWSMDDGWTAEIEALETLYALVRLTKPAVVLETGTWRGRAAEAVGQALRANGFGRLDTLEIDPRNARIATERIRQTGLADWVRVVASNSLEYIPDQPVDFLLMDSGLTIRGEEFRRFARHLTRHATIVVHDTGSTFPAVRAGIEGLVRDGMLTGLWIASPRGLFIGQAGDGTQADSGAR